MSRPLATRHGDACGGTLTESTDSGAATSSPYPPLYTPFKLLSLRVAPLLRDTFVRSNALTIAWGLLLVAASVAVAFERPVVAFLLVMPAITLDCLDGDLARCRNQSSTSGTYLEQIAHWIGNMALMAGAGAAVLLADPSPRNIALASSLTVIQSIYIAVVRQVRSDAADIPEHPKLRSAFRLIIKAYWNLSPIELPLLAIFMVFGVTQGVVLAITIGLAVSSVLIFVPHFVLTRAVDRRQWAAAKTVRSDSFSSLWSRYAEVVVAKHFPDARWWTPGVPQLPTPILSVTGRQPMAPGAPVLGAVWRDLQILLPRLFRTSGRVLPLACPTHAAIEAVLASLCRPGEEILVVGGSTTIGQWRAIAEHLDLQVAQLEVPFGAGLDPSALEAALARHPDARMVCLPLCETDDGRRTDVATIAGLVGDSDGSRLVVVDASVSLCVDDLRMDEWGIDAVVSSSSSGIMAPPGLSLVGLGPRALAELEAPAAPSNHQRRGRYLDLRTHLAESVRPLAPIPTPTLAGLFASVEMILAAGLDTVLAHRQRIADRFRRGCVDEAGLILVGRDQAAPTDACTVALLPEGVSLPEFQGYLFASLRLVVASGTTPDGATTLQFGHSGWLFEDDIDRVVESLVACFDAARGANEPRR